MENPQTFLFLEVQIGSSWRSEFRFAQIVLPFSSYCCCCLFPMLSFSVRYVKSIYILIYCIYVNVTWTAYFDLAIKMQFFYLYQLSDGKWLIFCVIHCYFCYWIMFDLPLTYSTPIKCDSPLFLKNRYKISSVAACFSFSKIWTLFFQVISVVTLF